MSELLYKDESYLIQGAFYKIYKTFRNNQKEIIYHKSLIEELKSKNFKVDENKRIDVYYNGKKVGVYVPDIIVNEIILIELKSKLMLTKEDMKQFWYYLKGTDYKVGYLVNFGKSDGVEFIRRVYDTARI